MSGTSDPEPDEKLRRAFGALEREDERAAPPFDAMLERARARGPRVTRSVSIARLSVALAPIAAAAAVVLFWGVSRAPEKRAEPSAAAAVSTPAAPTMQTTLPPLELDFLLQMPVSASLSALPDFDTDPVAQGRAPSRTTP